CVGATRRNVRGAPLYGRYRAGTRTRCSLPSNPAAVCDRPRGRRLRIMSGICGIFRFDGKPAAKSDLDRQMARLAHLGPDRTRTSSGGPIALGHLLMRVTREDTFDAQPIRDAETTLVADLRLDNREELAAALSISADSLSVMPDSAVLLAAYKKWGGDCVERLIGDFAFAIWDARKKSLTLGRDHMGQRHVFYHRAPGCFSFASVLQGHR